jgi:uncharacterized ferritin-like protein (DUF455 family)
MPRSRQIPKLYGTGGSISEYEAGLRLISASVMENGAVDVRLDAVTAFQTAAKGVYDTRMPVCRREPSQAALIGERLQHRSCDGIFSHARDSGLAIRTAAFG